MTSDELLLAELTLLALRSTLAGRGVHVGDADRWYLRGSRLPMQHAAAARALARLPKPVRCWVETRGQDVVIGHERITNETLIDGFPKSARLMRLISVGTTEARMRELDEATLDALRAIEAPTNDAVFCAAAGVGDAWLMVDEDQIERWQCDYPMLDGGWSMDVPATFLSSMPAMARLAASIGAARMISLGCDNDGGRGEDEGSIIIERDSQHQTVTVFFHEHGGGTCQCGSQSSWLATDLRVIPWVDRHLCDGCITAELQSGAESEAASIEEWIEAMGAPERRSKEDGIARRLQRLTRRWQRLKAPPEVRRVLEKYRAFPGADG